MWPNLLTSVEITRVLRSTTRGYSWSEPLQIVDTKGTEALFVISLSDLQPGDEILCYGKGLENVRYSAWPHDDSFLVPWPDASRVEATYSGDAGGSMLMMLDIVKSHRYLAMFIEAQCAVDSVWAMVPVQRPPSTQPNHAWTDHAGAGVLAAGLAVSPGLRAV